MNLLRLWIVTIVVVCLGQAGFSAAVQAQDAGEPKKSAAAADPLDEQVDRAIEISSRRYLTANVHTPWQIIHAALALRHELLLKLDDKKVPGIEWISSGPSYRGTPWFHTTQHGGRAQPFTQPYAFEGHPNQFLGYLTMSDLPMDHKIKTGRGDETITIADIVRNAQMEIHAGEEITWTLWALIHYLPPDAVWTNKYGEQWSIERMVQMQTYEPVERGACGGTHGLFALSYARNRYLQDRKPLRGVWLEADQKIKRYVAHTRALQNRDGSFSSNFFQGPGYSQDFTTRLHTSGHTLEWLSMALYDHELKEQWFRSGVAATAKDLIDNARAPMDCGPLYHALSGLVIYRERVRPEFQHRRPSEQEAKPETPPEVVQQDKEKPSAEEKPAQSPKPADVPIPAEVTAETDKPLVVRPAEKKDAEKKDAEEKNAEENDGKEKNVEPKAADAEPAKEPAEPPAADAAKSDESDGKKADGQQADGNQSESGTAEKVQESDCENGDKPPADGAADEEAQSDAAAGNT